MSNARAWFVDADWVGPVSILSKKVTCRDEDAHGWEHDSDAPNTAVADDPNTGVTENKGSNTPNLCSASVSFEMVIDVDHECTEVATVYEHPYNRIGNCTIRCDRP